MTKLTLLIATMNEDILQLVSKITHLPLEIDIIIGHQITNLSIDAIKLKETIESIRPNIKVIQRYEKGLSKSRNCALNNIKEGICLVTDDDVEFPDGFDQRILAAYNILPNADIITFQAKTPEDDFFKSYKTTSHPHTLRSVAKVSSIELTFNAQSIINSNLRFDERFGLGAEFSTSEEYIFLTDAIKNKLKVYYCPQTIAIHPKESSGKVFDENMLIAKGAVIRRVYKNKATLISTAFALKKYPLYRHKFGFIKAISLMLEGCKKL